MKTSLRRGLIALALIPTLGLAACSSSPDGGTIQVVRNGSVILPDNKNIREEVCPGSGTSWIGFGSEAHSYPDSSSQRTFKFNNDEDADAKPIEGLRTKDGVKVTLSGTFFLKTRFDCTPEGRKLVRAFDQAFVNQPEGQRPWEDWSGWLNAKVKPIIDANARDVILSLEAKEIVSSAALLARDQDVKDVDVSDVDNKSNVAKIEKAMADGLIIQLENKLGGKDKLSFFQEVTFNMEQPQLPEVDSAIAEAQAAFSKVANVRAERLKQQEQVKVEEQKRLVNLKKQAGYDACGSCARQDELRALPDGLTTLVLGDGSKVAVK